eukprot:812027-Amorphochlora_amoeboformis.AAC.2
MYQVIALLDKPGTTSSLSPMADFSRRGAISVLSKKSGSEGLLEGLSYDGRLSCVLVPACAVVLSYGGK